MKYRNLELRRNINEDVLCERMAERDPIDDEEIRRRYLSSPVKLRAYLQKGICEAYPFFYR